MPLGHLLAQIVYHFSWQFGPEIFEQSQKGHPNYFC